jgi:hypothetical protein
MIRKVLEENEYATGSDHELIEWEICRDLQLQANNKESRDGIYRLSQR